MPTEEDARRLIPGLSSRALAEINRIERRRYHPGDAYRALVRWRAMAYKPGPWVMYAAPEASGCDCCDPLSGVDPRALLEELCCGLPRRSAHELRALLEPLDERFLARTLNDPFASPCDPWWRRRLEFP
ncbi:hypothetical protein [Streptomyces sp. NPDC059909]|uniref:hypothetical protein n=1 Tax=Streptomyces sp. NPDC059909 TaxID=3346998 RepID=UPI00365B6981